MVDENEVVEQKQELVLSQEDIIKKLDSVSNEEDLKYLTQLFNFNLAKKDMIRANMESQLLDNILQEVNKRITDRPGEITNKDLLDYMSAMQSSIDRTSKSIQTIGDNSSVYNVSSTNNVNINIMSDSNQLSKESRSRITEVIKNIMKDINNNEQDSNIDIDYTNEGEKYND